MGISPEDFNQKSANTIVSSAEETAKNITILHSLIYEVREVNISLISNESGIRNPSNIFHELLDKVIEPLEAIRDKKQPKGADKIKKSLQEIIRKIEGLNSPESGRQALESLKSALKKAAEKEGFWDWVAQQKGKGRFINF